MKLLFITAIVEYENDVKLILKKANVKNYSYKEVVGHRNDSEDALESNWFGAELNEDQSILFCAFVQKEIADAVLEDFEAFNLKQKTLSQIHVAILNIEKMNTYEK